MRRLLVLAFVLACGDRADPEPDPPAPAPAAEEPDPAPIEVPTTWDPALAAQGRAVVDRVCVQCHAIDAPPLTAPTLREVADRYREAFADPTQAIEHLADYVRQPSPAQSQLPQVMLDEWGMMPPQALAPADRIAAGYFIWHLPDERSPGR